MGAYPVLRRFTVEEYLRFERASTAKSEFVNGQIYAMAGGTSDHARIVVNMAVRLQNQLEDGKCEVWTSDFRIAVSPTGPEFYPDLSVICGEPQFLDDTQDCALNPVVLFEVLSKSTAKYDRETKVAWYREIPTARHIALVSQHIIAVEHYVRLSSGEWKTEKLTDLAAVLELPAIDATLTLSAIYNKVGLPSRT